MSVDDQNPGDVVRSQKREDTAAEPVPEILSLPIDSPLPSIEREADDKIHVGYGGPLLVPREDIGEGLDVGEDLDLIAVQAKRIRKPQRREWFGLNPESELPALLLIHKPKADGIETEHYYVVPELRGPIQGELKLCRVFTYYSFTTKTHALWIVNVTTDNTWYDSIVPLFKQSSEFFRENAIRVFSDKENSRYRIKHKPMPSDVSWPMKTTSELLGEALGPEKFISSAEHPLYRDLIDGVELK